MSPQEPPLLARLREGLRSRSEEETMAIGEAFAGLFPEDTVLALHGTLGVGKSTFVRGLARGFGIHRPITSPSYTYYLIHGGGTRQLIHLDAYRLEGPDGVEGLLLEEYLKSPWCLAVEWPEKVGDWIPAKAWHLHLSIESDQSHYLRLS